MGRGYIAVEGKGEVMAINSLVVRLWQNLGLSPLYWAPRPQIWKGIDRESGMSEECLRLRKIKDIDALLIIRDADDIELCPKTLGPRMAEWLRRESFPFPCAVVLLYREYETLFLPCLARMAGVRLRRPSEYRARWLVAGNEIRGRL